jgi:hypothetical protein
MPRSVMSAVTIQTSIRQRWCPMVESKGRRNQDGIAISRSIRLSHMPQPVIPQDASSMRKPVLKDPSTAGKQAVGATTAISRQTPDLRRTA